MMKRSEIGTLREHLGAVVRISGWLSKLRDQKKMQFLIISDRTASIQAMNTKSENALSRDISNLTENSAVEITGKVLDNPSVKLGGVEIEIESIKVLSESEPSLPIKEDSAIDARMDWRYLDLRSEKKRLIFEVQTSAEHAMREFWMKNKFIEIHSPKLMGAASEGGAELFTMPYFDTEACLAQSPQFYKQMAMAAGFEKVFEIGPVFRANPSFTPRHDTEFTSVDMEISWIDSHEDVMKCEEEWLQYIFKSVKEQFGDQVKDIFDTEIIVPELPFPRVTMQEAYDILKKQGHIVPPSSKDLDPEGERKLCQYIQEKHGHEFVFVTDYPISARPFYHMRYSDQPSITKSFDLLWKGLEVTTGAQREHRYDVLLKQIDEHGIPRVTLENYTNFFKYGCPPHGGLGFGLSRMLTLMLGYANVREVTFLYRGPKRLSP